jgi:hypothetical protein
LVQAISPIVSIAVINEINILDMVNARRGVPPDALAGSNLRLIAKDFADSRQ